MEMLDVYHLRPGIPQPGFLVSLTPPSIRCTPDISWNRLFLPLSLPPLSSVSLSLSPLFHKLVITNAAQNPEHNDLIQEDMLVWNGTLRLHDAHLGGRIHKGNIMWIVDR
jgi:hypothetical protein